MKLLHVPVALALSTFATLLHANPNAVAPTHNPLSGTWSEQSTGAIKAPNVYAIAGKGPKDVFAAIELAGITSSMHWDGTQWAIMPQAKGGNGFPFKIASNAGTVWGTSPRISGDNVYQWTGDDPKLGWWATRAAQGKKLNAIFPVGKEMWAVGDGATIMRFVNNAWTDVGTGLQPKVPETINFTSVHGTSATDIWIVGTQGYRMHFDGQKTEAKTGGSNWGLESVFAASATDAWAVGQHGTVEHYDGKGWSLVQNTPIPDIRIAHSVWASSASDVYVAAEDVMAHYDGKTWRKETTPNVRLRTVWGSSASDVWAGGLSMQGIAAVIHRTP